MQCIHHARITGGKHAQLWHRGQSRDTIHMYYVVNQVEVSCVGWGDFKERAECPSAVHLWKQFTAFSYSARPKYQLPLSFFLRLQGGAHAYTDPAHSTRSNRGKHLHHFHQLSLRHLHNIQRSFNTQQFHFVCHVCPWWDERVTTRTEPTESSRNAHTLICTSAPKVLCRTAMHSLAKVAVGKSCSCLDQAQLSLRH